MQKPILQVVKRLGISAYNLFAWVIKRYDEKLRAEIAEAFRVAANKPLGI